MGGVRRAFVLLAAMLGCSGGDKDDTGSDELGLRTCGISDGSVFEVEITRLTLAPADPDGMQWDGSQPNSSWKSDLKEWRELSRTISTDGLFERDSYTSVESLTAYFEGSLFVSTSAPDPIATLYSSEDSGKNWTEEQSWEHLEGNTHRTGGLFLGRWTLNGDRRINLRMLDSDAPDSTRVGDLTISGVLAQSLADCGPMGLVLSEAEMKAQDSRIHALEIEVVSVY